MTSIESMSIASEPDASLAFVGVKKFCQLGLLGLHRARQPISMPDVMGLVGAGAARPYWRDTFKRNMRILGDVGYVDRVTEEPPLFTLRGTYAELSSAVAYGITKWEMTYPAISIFQLLGQMSTKATACQVGKKFDLLADMQTKILSKYDINRRVKRGTEFCQLLASKGIVYDTAVYDDEQPLAITMKHVIPPAYMSDQAARTFFGHTVAACRNLLLQEGREVRLGSVMAEVSNVPGYSAYEARWRLGTLLSNGPLSIRQWGGAFHPTFDSGYTLVPPLQPAMEAFHGLRAQLAAGPEGRLEVIAAGLPFEVVTRHLVQQTSI